MKLNQWIIAGLMAYVMAPAVSAQKAVLYSTTQTERWVESKIAVDKSINKPTDLRIYTDSLLQKVDGFGGTFNEISWDALSVLNPQERSKIMKNLFSSEGTNFVFGRTPMGCSDYSFGYYSYNEVKDDYEMRNFSIDRDRFILIPYIKEALKVRPDLRIWASPWSPPAWMKVNEHYSQKSQGLSGTDLGHNRLDPRRNVLGNVTGFKMQQGYLQAYALYFSKYLTEYKKNGVNIQMIMPQNEIAWTPCWPSCTWRPEDLAIFVSQYLGPQFDKDSIDTDLWLGTVNYPNPEYVHTFFRQKDVQKYIKGVGVQWTGMKALPDIQEKHPNYTYMQTENMCGDSENDWTALEKTWEAVLNCFNNGVSSYMYWNMVLGDDCKSWWGWAQNTLVIINRNTHEIRYTDEYYLMQHLSRFVQPGSHLLKASKDNVLAFLGADGKVTVVAYNPQTEQRNYSLTIGDLSFTMTLKPKSINTLRF